MKWRSDRQSQVTDTRQRDRERFCKGGGVDLESFYTQSLLTRECHLAYKSTLF